MKPQEIVEQLRKIPLFAKVADPRDELGERDLYRLVEAGVVNESEYGAGEWLFAQGDRSTRLYYILEGAVELTRFDFEGVPRFLKTLGPGDSVGETGVLFGDFHDATAEAMRAMRVLYVEHDDFAAQLKKLRYLNGHLNVSPHLAHRPRVDEFDWLRENEHVIFAERRHWVYLLRVLFLPVVLGLILLPIFYLVAVSLTGLLATALLTIIGLALLVIFGFAVWSYSNWRDDLFVLTTQRILHYERVWPVSQIHEETILDNLQDVQQVQNGIAPKILNYGDIFIQTAGETVLIDLTGVPNPAELTELIFREIERHRARQVVTQRRKIREQLESRLFPKTPDATKAAEGVLVTAKIPRRSLLLLFFNSIKDYLFPDSWTTSEDGASIIWRRFWLPGVVKYWWLWALMVASSVGGIFFFTDRLDGLYQTALTVYPAAAPLREFRATLDGLGHQSLLTPLTIWLFIEAVIFAALLWVIQDWRNDFFQITPSRIILVDRKPFLLSDKRRETTLDKIQNISSEVPGILARFFHYGDVMLETAGTLGKFKLRWVRYPEKVQSEISKRQQAYFGRRAQVDAQRRQAEMLSWFTMYDDIKKRAASGGPPAGG